MRNTLTPAGIEPATFRFVAQRLNHSATAQSLVLNVSYAISDIDHKVSYTITDIDDASYAIADIVSYTVNDTDHKSLI